MVMLTGNLHTGWDPFIYDLYTAYVVDNTTYKKGNNIGTVWSSEKNSFPVNNYIEDKWYEYVGLK